MVEGGCLCGAVRFSVDEFCSDIFKCHCSKCRKAFGGASSAAALAQESAFNWLQGQDAIREYRKDKGFRRCFCPECGSLLPQFLPDYHLHWIPMGLLDDDPGIRLKRHLYVDSKAAWEVLDEHSERLPEGLDI